MKHIVILSYGGRANNIGVGSETLIEWRKDDTNLLDGVIVEVRPEE